MREIDQNALMSMACWDPDYTNESAWMGHMHFAYWLIQELKPKRFVELGTHLGVSFFAFCQAVKELELGTECHAVDRWYGDAQAGFYDSRVYGTVLQIRDDYYRGIAHLHKMLFSEALNNFKDNTVDLLHIDGFHSYEAVHEDFTSWLPKLTENAIVLLHDTNEYQEGFGVHRLWSEIKQNYKWTVEFLHSHGLGVVSLSQRDVPPHPSLLTSTFPSPAHKFLESLGIKYTLDIAQKRRIAELEALIAEKDETITRQHKLLSAKTQE